MCVSVCASLNMGIENIDGGPFHRLLATKWERHFNPITGEVSNSNFQLGSSKIFIQPEMKLLHSTTLIGFSVINWRIFQWSWKSVEPLLIICPETKWQMQPQHSFVCCRLFCLIFKFDEKQPNHVFLPKGLVRSVIQSWILSAFGLISVFLSDLPLSVNDVSLPDLRVILSERNNVISE